MKNIEFYEELDDLVNMHAGWVTGDGKEIICFKLIKDILNEGIKKENMSVAEKMLAREQLSESIELLEDMGVTVKYKEEFFKVLR